MQKRLVILDFDGTIADTRATILRTFRMTIEELSLEARSDEECGSTIGLPLVEGFHKLYPSISPEQSELYTETYRRIFRENKRNLSPDMFAGVLETIKALHDKGLTITIASSRSRRPLLEFVESFGLHEMIPYVLGLEDCTQHKPDPEPVLKTLRELKFRADETLVVGDMPYDILMGARAGAETCGVSYGNASADELRAAGATHIIDTFPQLLTLIE